MATNDEDRTRSPCTPEELLEIVSDRGTGMIMMPSRACDEVYPNVYISEK